MAKDPPSPLPRTYIFLELCAVPGLRRAVASHTSRARCSSCCSSRARLLGDAGRQRPRASWERCSRALGMSAARPREGWNSSRYVFFSAGL